MTPGPKPTLAPTKYASKLIKNCPADACSKCQCSTCKQYKDNGKSDLLPRYRTCYKCGTYLGLFDVNQPYQCHNCHHYKIPVSVLKSAPCECNKPTKSCKNHRCIRYFMQKKEYINNHHRVELGFEIPPPINIQNAYQTKPMKIHQNRHVNEKYTSDLQSLTNTSPKCQEMSERIFCPSW